MIAISKEAGVVLAVIGGALFIVLSTLSSGAIESEWTQIKIGLLFGVGIAALVFVYLKLLRRP